MSLRRQENVQLVFRKGLFSSKGVVTLHIGARTTVAVGKVHRDAHAEAQLRQREYPVYITRVRDRNYWQFRDLFYWDNDGLEAPAVHALLVTRLQRHEQRVNRAQQMVAMGTEPRSAMRGVIADDVKQLVWQRDGGRCRSCGSTTELQFDHVIPVSMGGASTPENLQILCGPCNRRKGAAITLS